MILRIFKNGHKNSPNSPIYVTYALRKKLSTLLTNLEPFQPSIVFHIETSHLICGAIYKMQHQANIG